MQSRKRMTIWGGVGLALAASLLWLLTACGPFADASEPATATPPAGTAATSAAPIATTAATTAVTPSARPSAGATSAATSAPAGAPTAANAGQLVRVAIVTENTEARYRVREQLARINFPSDAIGATKAVTGTIIAQTDGTLSPDSRVQVDLSTLTSDERQRDNFIKQNTLQTNRYRYAVFVPTKIEGLSLPPAGDVSFKLTGDLTVRNVTKPVTWTVKGTIKGDEATGTASTSFNFAYFNLERPNVFTVLSIEDNITLEIDVHVKRVS
jgi:polyisoprenoid-binding protein YceI